MKKLAYTLTILFTLLTTSQSIAQYLGLKGGLTFSRLNIGGDADEQLRFGYHGGLFYNIPVSDAFSVQPEVIFTTKGTRSEFDLDDFQGKTSLRLNYIDIPVLGILEFGESFEVMAGPYIGFMVSSNFQTEVANGTLTYDLSRESFRQFDYGAALGFALNFGAIQTGANYYLGLQDISESTEANILLGDPKNRYLQLFVAFRIGDYDSDTR